MLFGHQNDDTNQTPADAPDVPAAPPVPGPQPGSSVNPLAVDPETGASLPAVPPVPADADDTAGTPSLDEPAGNSITTHSAPMMEPPAPAEPAAEEEPAPVDTPPVAPATPAAPAAPDDLLSLKQQALQQLSPLVDQLDQTPEERFRTTMMMIQSTDNQTLIKDAYEAAQAIPDEKARAQALLDVVNEINYFTQQKSAA